MTVQLHEIDFIRFRTLVEEGSDKDFQNESTFENLGEIYGFISPELGTIKKQQKNICRDQFSRYVTLDETWQFISALENLEVMCEYVIAHHGIACFSATVLNNVAGFLYIFVHWAFSPCCIIRFR
ncbi:MAG: hypothetical protein EZS28_046059, partial [Streblomastix strix]